MAMKHFESLKDLISYLPYVLLLESILTIILLSQFLELTLEISSIGILHKDAKRAGLLIKEAGLVADDVRNVDRSQ
jgi:hypothetical protein